MPLTHFQAFICPASPRSLSTKEHRATFFESTGVFLFTKRCVRYLSRCIIGRKKTENSRQLTGYHQKWTELLRALVISRVRQGRVLQKFSVKPDVIQSTPNFGGGFYPSDTHFSSMAIHQIPCINFRKNKILAGNFKQVAGETGLARPDLIKKCLAR
jgi:hypothetical protein